MSLVRRGQEDARDLRVELGVPTAETVHRHHVHQVAQRRIHHAQLRQNSDDSYYREHSCGEKGELVGETGRLPHERDPDERGGDQGEEHADAGEDFTLRRRSRSDQAPCSVARICARTDRTWGGFRRLPAVPGRGPNHGGVIDHSPMLPPGIPARRCQLF